MPRWVPHVGTASQSGRSLPLPSLGFPTEAGWHQMGSLAGLGHASLGGPSTENRRPRVALSSLMLPLR